MKSRLLIRTFVLSVLKEAAIAPEAALKSGLALAEIADERSNNTAFILYKPSHFQERVNELLNKAKEAGSDLSTQKRDLGSLLFDDPTGIVGYVEVKPDDGGCYDAYSIVYTAAEKGYGPMMYDIAMSRVDSHTLVPDRKSVSKAAENVWARYLNGRSDVEKLPLDDITNPKTKPKEDDCTVHTGVPKDSPLNYAYRGTPNAGGSLISAHYNFLSTIIKQLKAAGLVKTSPNQIETNLFYAGEGYFSSRYKN